MGGLSPADGPERTDSGLGLHFDSGLDNPGLNFENLEMSLSREGLQLSRSACGIPKVFPRFKIQIVQIYEHS